LSSPTRRLVIEPLEERALLDGVGLLPGQTAFDDGDAAGWGSADHPLQEMFAVPPDVAPNSAYKPGEILIKLKDPRPRAQLMELAATVATVPTEPNQPTDSLDGLLSTYNVQSIERVFTGPSYPGLRPVRSSSATGAASMAADGEEKSPDLDRWYRVGLPASIDVTQAVAHMNAMPEVEVAELNSLWKLADLPDETTDPDISEQWHHEKAGVRDAWAALQQEGINPGGSRDVIVAVIDSGVDYTHQDLVGNMWVNVDEVPDNGVDDDGNGFVDDIHGASVVSDGRSHSGDPIDLHGHGTHVAGIVAAQANNGLGGVGVAYNTQIMAIRAVHYNHTLATQDIAEAILYAVENGADVINMSFGGYTTSELVEDALKMALNQAVLVAAAGNDGRDSPMFPASLPWVLAVEAADEEGNLASFSNAGDFAAPGVSIYSTLPDDQYAAWSGTSMAAPIVSGIAALTRSFYWQRDIYSSRFITGKILGAGGDSGAGGVLDQPPVANVKANMNGVWVFDDATIDPGNDEDGSIDSGETVFLALSLTNKGAGRADNVAVSLRARAEDSVFDDPYVTLLMPTVQYGSIEPFETLDNGLIYDQDENVVGVDTPFVFSVDPNCPNDHQIEFEVTITMAGITVTQTSSLVTTENGKQATFAVRLDIQPTADVTIELSSSDPGEGTVSPSSLTFTPANWDIEQTATVTGVDDAIDDGNVEYTINTGPVFSADPGYHDRYVADVSVTNTDYDVPGFIIMESDGATAVTEGDETADTYSLGLTHFPAARVRVHIFAPGSQIILGTTYHSWYELWDRSKEFRVTALDDTLVEGAHTSLIRHIVESEDPFFDGITFSIPVSITDNDEAEEPGDALDSRLVFPVERGRRLPSILSEDMELTADDYWIVGGPVLIEDGATLTIRPGAEVQWGAISEDPFDPGPQTGSILVRGGLVIEGTQESPVSLFPSELISGQATEIEFAPEGWGQMHYAKVRTPKINPGLDIVDHCFFEGYVSDEHFLGGADVSNTIFSHRLDGHPVRGRYDTCLFEAPWAFVYHDDIYNSTFLQDNETNMRVVLELGAHSFRYNAFLSKYWDVNTDHWMSIQPTVSSGEPGSEFDMLDNYWGTTDTALIDHVIWDYNDNFYRARVVYQPPPEHGFETTWPFAERVEINGVSAESEPEMGAGPVTFTVTFNRDMDPTIQPFVTFGPSPPHTDFLADPTGINDAVFAVTLSIPHSETVTVDYATENGTAVAGVDYQAVSGTLTFKPGEVQKWVTVPLINDMRNEPDKTFSVKLSNPTLVDIADDRGAGTIEDDDPLLLIDDVTLLEGDVGTTDAVFAVTLSRTIADVVTVEYVTVDGTANAGIDYEATDGKLVFVPGQTEQTFSVPVIGNLQHDGDRAFSVELAYPTNATVGDDLGQCVIEENDPQLFIEDVRVIEGDTGTIDALFTVSLSAEPTKTIRVDYATEDGTATAGQDYEATSGTLTFDPGGSAEQTIAIPVIGDAGVELNETFFVNLSNALGGVISDGQGEATILGDDGPLLSIDDVTLAEGDSGIDPWFSYLGGNEQDRCYDIAVDASGNILVTGYTESADFPVVNEFDNSRNGSQDAFVAKISPDGHLLWSSYLGGNGNDGGEAVAVDGAGNVWVAGWTESSGWISGGFDESYGGGILDGFVAKISPDGQLLWSSCLGGGGNDAAFGIAVDLAGNGFVTGQIESSGWASGGFDTEYGGGYDTFVAKIAPDGQLLWSSYLGGSGLDFAFDVAVDASGDALLCGATESSGWVADGFDTSYSRSAPPGTSWR